MGFRDYSPTANRFLTPDFYTSAMVDLRLGATPATANRYAFAAGNPIGNIDVDGHFPVPNWIKQIGGFFKGAGEQVWDTVTGVWDLGKAALDCFPCIGKMADLLEYAVDNPDDFLSGVWHGIWDPIATDWNNGNYGEAIGRGTIDVASLILGGKGLNKIKDAVRAGKAAEAAAPVRLARDIAIERTHPRPTKASTASTIGRSPTQHAALWRDIRDAQRRGATAIRVNPQQVNAARVRVGWNRPDLQYTINGVRYYIEYETEWPGRWPAHQLRITANDPAGIVIGKHVP